MDPEALGQNLIQLRAGRGASLREVARQAGISPASLSAIEKGQSSPTLATLNKVLKALGTGFADFFSPALQANESPVFRPGEMRTIEDAHRTYVLLFPKRGDLKFEMVHETIAPTEAEPEWEVHDCDLGGLVLQGGPGRIEIEGQGAWRLRRGDVFYIKAGLRHRATNLGHRPLKQITVWDPPKY